MLACCPLRKGVIVALVFARTDDLPSLSDLPQFQEELLCEHATRDLEKLAIGSGLDPSYDSTAFLPVAAG